MVAALGQIGLLSVFGRIGLVAVLGRIGLVAVLGRIGLLAVLGRIGRVAALGQIGLVAVLGVLAVFGLLVVHNRCGQRFGGGQQGSVGFLRARQANVMELDVAIYVAGLSGNDLAALIVYQLKAEVVLLGQGAAFQLLGGTQVKGKSRGHCGIVDVGKLGAINDLLAQLIHRVSGDQRAVYEIHMDGNGVPLVIVGEAASAAIGQFVDGVAIVALLGKGQGGGKGHAAVGLVLAESNLAGCVLHHKGELAVLQGAVNVAFQLLGGSQRYGRRQVVAGGVGGNVVHHCRVLDLAVGTGDRVVDRDHKAYDAALGGACLDGPFQLAGRVVQRAAVGDGFFNQSGVGGDLVGDVNGNGCGLAVDPTDGVGQLLAGRYQLAVDTCAAFARYTLGRQRVEVHEAGRAAGNGGTILAQRGGGHQLAGCGVVGHSHGHGVFGGVPLDVRVVGVGVLGDGVRVGADCIVIDAAEAAAHSLAGGAVQRQGVAVGGHRGIISKRGQLKGEAFAISPGAADQGLAYRQGKRGAFCLVGVGKGRHSGGAGQGRLVIRVAAVTVGGAAVVGDRAANQLAFMVILNIHFDLIVVGVVGDAGDGFSVLGDIIGVNARRGERQLIAAAQCGRIVRAGAADNSNAVVLGRHVRGIRTRQLKAEDIAALPRAAQQILLDFEQGRSVGHAGGGVVDVVKQGIASLALVGVGDSRLQLAVIAQRDLDRCGDGICLGDAEQVGVILGDGVGIGADLIKGKLAERRAVGVLVDRHRGEVGLGGCGRGPVSDGKVERVVVRPVQKIPLCIQDTFVQRQRGFDFARVVGVGKGDGGVAAVGSGHFPGTILILVIGDFHFHVSLGGGIGIGGAVKHAALYKVGVGAVGDVGAGAFFFTDEIVISFADICAGKGDGLKIDPAVGVVGRCGRVVCRQGDGRSIGYVVTSLVLVMQHNGKAELPGGKAGGVGRVNVNFARGQVDDFFRSAVGVCKGSGIDCIAGRLTVNNFLDGGRGAQLAVVIRDHDGHTVDGAVVRNTHDLAVAGVDLVDIVLVSAGLGKGDTAEVEGNGSVRRSTLGLALNDALDVVRARLNASGHRGVSGAVMFQTELEFVGVQPGAAGQRFCCLERVLQRDGRRLVTVGNGYQRGGGAGLAGLDRNGGTAVGRCTSGGSDADKRVARGGSAIGVAGIFAYGDGSACGQAKDLGSLTGL